MLIVVMYQNKNLKILNADCMDIMKEYEDDYFDLAIIDPPYGIREQGGKNRKGYSKAWKNQKEKNYIKKDWDNKPETKEYFT